ncbi:MAG: ribonuclease Z [Kurthia sp.]|nr:ribonuclease Z [Candidatus Kurthia equi]
MQLQFLGTGAGMPSKSRNTSSLAVKLLEECGDIWLFDCGEATQHQILHTTIKPRKINKIFITHLHGDHIFGLPGFLSSRSFLGGTDPVTIYGPPGLENWLRTTMQVTGTHLTYAIHYEVIQEGVLFEDEQFAVRCKKLQHVIDSYGFRIEQKNLPGKLDIEFARSLGVPKGPLLGQLKNGQDVTLENGTVIKSESVVSEPVPGFTLAILGDTKFCPGSIELAQNADVVIHEATFDKGTEKLAAVYGHSTNVEAAKVAREANAEVLLMNHISSRFLSCDLTKLKAEAQEVFPNCRIVNDFEQYNWQNHHLIKVQEEAINGD